MLTKTIVDCNKLYLWFLSWFQPKEEICDGCGRKKEE